MPDVPIFHNPSLAVALMNLTETNDDDDETRTASTQRFDAKAALVEARGKHARATRIGYAKEDLAGLQARVTRAEQEADRLITRLRDQADQRLRRARVRRTEVLNQALERPAGIDAVSDRLDRADAVRRLEGEPLETRTLMLAGRREAGAAPCVDPGRLAGRAPALCDQVVAALAPR